MLATPRPRSLLRWRTWAHESSKRSHDGHDEILSLRRAAGARFATSNTRFAAHHVTLPDGGAWRCPKLFSTPNRPAENAPSGVLRGVRSRSDSAIRSGKTGARYGLLPSIS